jgi:hypothetical protein
VWISRICSVRNPRGWSHTAIRAILTNPVYGGRRVWGKQRRFEELLDLNDVSADHVTQMRWRAASGVDREHNTVDGEPG